MQWVGHAVPQVLGMGRPPCGKFPPSHRRQPYGHCLRMAVVPLSGFRDSSCQGFWTVLLRRQTAAWTLNAHRHKPRETMFDGRHKAIVSTPSAGPCGSTGLRERIHGKIHRTNVTVPGMTKGCIAAALRFAGAPGRIRTPRPPGSYGAKMKFGR